MKARLLYTPADAARRLKLTRWQLRREMAAGRLEYLLVGRLLPGRSLRITDAALVDYIERRSTDEPR